MHDYRIGTIWQQPAGGYFETASPRQFTVGSLTHDDLASDVEITGHRLRSTKGVGGYDGKSIHGGAISRGEVFGRRNLGGAHTIKTVLKRQSLSRKRDFSDMGEKQRAGFGHRGKLRSAEHVEWGGLVGHED
jgi:hypothetical protein